MCKFPKYRLPIPEDVAFNPGFKRFGWSNKSQAFIFDQRDTAALEKISFHFRKYLDNLQIIPCGQCMECRIHKSRELAQRALAEVTMHSSSWFVTLTYDDEHIMHTYEETLSRTTGEYGLHPCLVKRDFQLFAKRLRKIVSERNEPELVIFYCGEYGPKHGRPHFHAIIYGLQLHDLELFKVEDNMCYFTSKTIEDAWLDYEHEKHDPRPMGFHLVTEVNWDTCAYVSRYVTKKSLGKNEKDYQNLCKEHDIVPQLREFHQGPKRPGLGLTYYQQNKDRIYEYDEVVLPGGQVSKPCSYYDKKYDIDYPGKLEPIKKNRELSSKLSKMRMYFGMSAEQAAAAEQASHERRERQFKRLKQRQDF